MASHFCRSTLTRSVSLAALPCLRRHTIARLDLYDTNAQHGRLVDLRARLASLVLGLHTRPAREAHRFERFVPVLLALALSFPFPFSRLSQQACLEISQARRECNAMRVSVCVRRVCTSASVCVSRNAGGKSEHQTEAAESGSLSLFLVLRGDVQ